MTSERTLCISTWTLLYQVASQPSKEKQEKCQQNTNWKPREGSKPKQSFTGENKTGLGRGERGMCHLASGLHFLSKVWYYPTQGSIQKGLFALNLPKRNEGWMLFCDVEEKSSIIFCHVGNDRWVVLMHRTAASVLLLELCSPPTTCWRWSFWGLPFMIPSVIST